MIEPHSNQNVIRFTSSPINKLGDIIVQRGVFYYLKDMPRNLVSDSYNVYLGTALRHCNDLMHVHAVKVQANIDLSYSFETKGLSEIGCLELHLKDDSVIDQNIEFSTNLVINAKNLTVTGSIKAPRLSINGELVK